MEKATLELHVGEAAFGSAELGMMLQVEAAKVGLTIDLKREPSDGYWSNVWRKKSFHAGEWDARPTDDLLLTQGFKSDAAWNETGYKSEKLDKLIDEGRGTLDFAKRKEIYHEIQKIFYEDGTSIVPAFADFIAAVNAKVRGLIPVRTSSLSGANFADSVWMEA
jgi:peptide/nickel transport system substrate-binding protein